MEPESYYTADGDIAYIRVRSPRGPVRSEQQPWGLHDYDEQTGDLVGLKVCPRRRFCRRSSSSRPRAWNAVARALGAASLTSRESVPTGPSHAWVDGHLCFRTGRRASRAS
jgi:hypothetical protein